MNGHPSNGPILIGGAGRSGTTLLRTMLNAHHRIYCGPELKVLPEIAETYRKLTGPLADVMASYRNSPQEVADLFRKLIEGMIDGARRSSGKQRWGEKTPHNIKHIAALAEIFPDAKFIHVIRDGRDVACSLVTMNWINPSTGAKVDFIQNIAAAARYWRQIVDLVRRQTSQAQLAEKVLEVRYEQLVRETEPTLRQVLEFVGEPWDEAVLSHHLTISQGRREPVESSTDQTRRPIYESSIGRWRSQMTDTEKEAFKHEANALLVELKYTTGDW